MGRRGGTRMFACLDSRSRAHPCWGAGRHHQTGSCFEKACCWPLWKHSSHIWGCTLVLPLLQTAVRRQAVRVPHLSPTRLGFGPCGRSEIGVSWQSARLQATTPPLSRVSCAKMAATVLLKSAPKTRLLPSMAVGGEGCCSLPGLSASICL